MDPVVPTKERRQTLVSEGDIFIGNLQAGGTRTLFERREGQHTDNGRCSVKANHRMYEDANLINLSTHAYDRSGQYYVEYVGP